MRAMLRLLALMALLALVVPGPAAGEDEPPAPPPPAEEAPEPEVPAGEPVEVPECVGLVFEDAQDLLEEMGLGFTVEYTPGVPEGFVISQVPAPGETLPRGSKVMLKVAGEPPPPPEVVEKIPLPTPAPPPEGLVVPSGMVYVAAAEAAIGTEAQRLGQLLDGRPAPIVEQFLYETPRHPSPLRAYCIDRTEITHAQYRVFFEDTSLTTYDTTTGGLANLEEVAGSLLGIPQDQWHRGIGYERLYEVNRDLLWDTMPDLVVRNAGGQVDEEATRSAFRHAPIARGMELKFATRMPPSSWVGLAPTEDQLDLPVTWVSYDDAEAFAEWAGKHVQTEEEFEFAGRSPEGFFYPWGNHWYTDGSHANWGAKHTDPVHYTPIALPVDSMPEGRSWVGCHHLLGNAAEWTSSWFGPYPGNPRRHAWMGQFVKVIRGASAIDQDTLALRLSARNWVGKGAHAPPRPENRFEWVSFRCAWYPVPGADQLGPVMRRVYRDRQIKVEDVMLERYAGAVATQFAPVEEEVAHHVHVLGRAHAFVVVPLQRVLPLTMEKPRVRKWKELVKESVRDDPWPVAIFHTDVPLAKVYVRAPRKPGEEEEDERGRGRGRGRGRQGPPAPKVQKGTCPPGTYLLAIWHERLAIVAPSLEFVCFITPERKSIKGVDWVDAEEETLPPAVLDVTPEADLVDVRFSVRVGGKYAGDETLLEFALLLEAESGSLANAGTWATRQTPE